MKTQNIQKSQSNPKPKEQGWRHHNTQFQIMLQSHGNKTHHGTGTQIDIQATGIKQRAQKQSHTTTAI